MDARLALVHEDDALLVVNKPAGLVCHPTKADGYSSLISRVRLHLGPAAEPPQMVNRLDRETSGLVVVAKTAGAARELRQLWESGAVTKRYLAIVNGVPQPAEGLIDAPLGKDEASCVAIKDCVRPDGKPAQTHYHVQRSFRREGRDFSRLEVTPRTGRKHQIRIHLAHAGHPLVGDKIYGGDERLYLAFVEGRLDDAGWARLRLPCQALHAGELAFPWRAAELRFHAPPESWFAEFVSDEPAD